MFSEIKKHRLSILIILLIGLVVAAPSFKLALFGDDWLTLYRYKIKVGEWSDGTYNHFTYLFNPYGPQDTLFGLLYKVLKNNGPLYYVLSFLFRLAVSVSIYTLSYKFTKSKSASLLAGLFFITTIVGIEATNWVFNISSFVSLVLLTAFIYLFIKSQTEEKLKTCFYSGAAFLITFVSSPIRMHGLVFFVLAMDFIYLLRNRNKKSFLAVVLRQSLYLTSILLLRFIGRSFNLSPATKALEGISAIQNSINLSDYSFIATPIITIGRFIFPENIFKSPLFLNDMFIISTGLGVILLAFYSIYKTRKSDVSYFITAGFVWTFAGFAFPYIWSPLSPLASVHRYYIIPIYGFALLIAGIISSLNGKFRLVLSGLVLFLIIIQGVSTRNYFNKLIPLHGVEISNSIWNSLPDVSQSLTGETVIFYFEGNTTILYNTLTFGFPPHIALEYNTVDPEKLPIPVDDWDELVTSFKSGSNLNKYSREQKPVPLNNIYAFRLKNSELVNITKEVRSKLDMEKY